MNNGHSRVYGPTLAEVERLVHLVPNDLAIYLAAQVDRLAVVPSRFFAIARGIPCVTASRDVVYNGPGPNPRLGAIAVQPRTHKDRIPVLLWFTAEAALDSCRTRDKPYELVIAAFPAARDLIPDNLPQDCLKTGPN